MQVPSSKEHDDRITACKTPKQNEKPSSAVKVGGKRDIGELRSQMNICMKVHVNDASQKELKSLMAKENKSLQKPEKQETSKTVFKKPKEVKPVTKNLSSSFSRLDVDSERRSLDLIEEAASSTNLEYSREKYEVSSTRISSLKDVAARTALQILEDGGSMKMQKLFVIQSFFARYLIGRFSISYIAMYEKMICVLMKNKLEDTEKKCMFKNYDLVQDKNDKNSAKRDWMTAQKEELPTRLKLIMVLNLSSGVETALANKFIDKALEFKPKILLLILPKEAQRLCKMIPP